MSSKRRIRKSSCDGKIVHDKASAYIRAKRLWKKGERVHAYKCRFGDHWHVGHWTGTPSDKISAAIAQADRRRAAYQSDEP